MATVIQIKRSTGASAPAVSDLAEGELAYVQDRSNDGASAKLFIESVDSGGNAAIHEVGGKFYTDIVDGATATPADFKVGNGSTSGGTLKIMGRYRQWFKLHWSKSTRYNRVKLYIDATYN